MIREALTTAWSMGVLTIATFDLRKQETSRIS
jgi:hypothetical protein